jgi:hypothetical protein
MGAFKVIKNTLKEIFSPPNYKELNKINKKYEKEEEKGGPKGLGGWLVLIQIGFWIGTLYLISFTIGMLLMAISEGIYFFLFFLLGGGLVIINIYALILMYKKRRRFPIIAILSLWGEFGLVVLIYGLAILINLEDSSQSIAEVVGAIALSLITTLIWTAYFKESKRVKNTFTK